MTARIRINNRGMKRLWTLPAVTSKLRSSAYGIQSRAGGGFKVTPFEVARGRGRPRYAVVTDTYDAAVDEAQNRTLTRAVGGRNTWRK